MKNYLFVYLIWNILYYVKAFLPPSSNQQGSNSKIPKPIIPSQIITNKKTSNHTPQPTPSTTKHNPIDVIYEKTLQSPSLLSSEKKTPPFTEEDFQFQLQWYVIAETKHLRPNTPYEAKIWGKTYVYWKDQQNQYYAIQNICNHRGAVLSKGTINQNTNCIQCPYHGLEFNGYGQLKKIPGQTLGPKPMPNLWNQPHYTILEKEGWLYLNIIPNDVYDTEKITKKTLEQTLYMEPEASMYPSSRVFCNIPSIPTYSRIVSENLLDILHITYVHSFGNKDSPTPLNEPIPYILRAYNTEGILTSCSHLDNQSMNPITTTTDTTEYSPFSITKQHRKNKHQRTISNKARAILFRNHVYSLLNPITTITKRFFITEKQNITNNAKTVLEFVNDTIPSKNQHYGIRYLFETNKKSVIRKVFHYNHIIIETEFILPHLTVSRVRFGPFYKTVVAFSLPVTEKETHLFIKLYRNYWIKESVPSLPFPFSLFSYLLGTVVESLSDSLTIWMLKETFKEDAGVLERLTNDVEQQGKYNLKYDKFPYLYRNLYKKYIHTKESPTTPPFPPFFPLISPTSVLFLLDKTEEKGNSSSSPLFPLSPLPNQKQQNSKQN
jgi:phenylpropionate dioxygenase-like ring-hydroxylating dioxygenase large terminal subunit